MRMAKPSILALAAFLLGLSACSTCDVAGVEVRENLATGKLVFIGPYEQRSGGACDASGEGERLRSELDLETGAIAHWVDARTEWTGSGWSYWDEAYDRASGRRLQLGLAHRMVGDCSRIMGLGCEHKEQVSAVLPDDLLRASAKSGEGLSIRFARRFGFNGLTASFAADQVKAHVDSIDKRVSSLNGGQ